MKVVIYEIWKRPNSKSAYVWRFIIQNFKKYVNNKQLVVKDSQLHDICKTHYSARSAINALNHFTN